MSEIKVLSEFDASDNQSFQGHGMLATGNRDPRFPDRITPSISEDAWREIRGSRSSAYQGFQGPKTLALQNHDMRISDTIISR